MKKILAQGKSIEKLMKICEKKKLTNQNSVVHIKNNKDLDAEWYITEK